MVGISKRVGSAPLDSILFQSVCILLLGGLTFQALKPLIHAVQVINRGHPHFTFLAMALAIGGALTIAFAVVWNWRLERVEIREPYAKKEESTFIGTDLDSGEEVYLSPESRTMHTQVIGTTNAGKTSSIILPMIVSDIESGRGLILVDGKSDKSLLSQIYAHAIRAGRKEDFQVFSLANPYISSTFNPFCHGTSDQIAERVFSAFTIENSYYGALQFSALRTVIELLVHQRATPTPGIIRELLRNKDTLLGWAIGLKDENLKRDVAELVDVPCDQFKENYKGLVNSLGHFSQGDLGSLFNARYPDVVLSEVLKQQRICYFQLPTNQFKFLGEATGKLLLQTLQSVVSEVQVSGMGRLKSLFSVYLDDFMDYMYPGFTSLLNKSRSANVGVVFSHQAKGDLDKIGPEFAQTVMTNTNIKVVMRSNDHESAEIFSKQIGTLTGEKTTERRKMEFLSEISTGEQSVRTAEEFIVHPNVFKYELAQGQGIVVIPHARGRIVKQLQFKPIQTLTEVPLPMRPLSKMNYSFEANAPGQSLNQVSSFAAFKKKSKASPKILE